jgi:universal stress protein E
MDKLTRILAVLNGTDTDDVVVAKAVALAHKQGAALELFLCEAERAYSLLHSYDPTGVAAFRRESIRESCRYLESLRDTVVGADVSISVDAVCESPLYEAIVRKVVRSHADFVIKSAAGGNASRRVAWDANDWQLMRTCPATLWLCRGKSWQPRPRFAAAVDLPEQETAGLPREILRVSGLLADACCGAVDVVFSEPRGTETTVHQSHVASLERLSSAAELCGANLHVLSGEAVEALPLFAANGSYDALIMGALTHRQGLSPLVGTLTGKLVDALDCDFVLVKPAGYRSEVGLTSQPVNEIPEEFENAPVPPPAATAPGFVSPWQLRAR